MHFVNDRRHIIVTPDKVKLLSQELHRAESFFRRLRCPEETIPLFVLLFKHGKGKFPMYHRILRLLLGSDRIDGIYRITLRGDRGEERCALGALRCAPFEAKDTGGQRIKVKGERGTEGTFLFIQSGDDDWIKTASLRHMLII
jgi:hypothetical protein